MRGKIIRGIGGLYYVHAVSEAGEPQIYECRARGIFRKDHRKPLVGDDVEMDVLDGGRLLGNIRELLPRRSELIRPAVANIDQAMVIFSIVSPRPSFNLLDRFLVRMGQQEIPCIICFNKLDLDDAGEGAGYRAVYEGCGYRTLTVSARDGVGIEELKRLLAGRTTTVAGPSGVGKSSLAAYYPEFAAYEKYCRFSGCSHIVEPVCGVRDAVAEGAVSRVRYDNYCHLYEELKNRKRF